VNKLSDNPPGRNRMVYLIDTDVMIDVSRENASAALVSWHLSIFTRRSHSVGQGTRD
jgi:hypothetical protein